MLGCHGNALDSLTITLGATDFPYILSQPFHGCNAADPLHPKPHSWFEQFAGPHGAWSAGFPFMRFFVEPVWLTVNSLPSADLPVFSTTSGTLFVKAFSAAV